MKLYIDISHHHPVTNWATLKKNCPFLISKATQGTSFVDPTLSSFIRSCERNKIPYWLYTYLNKGNELAQAKFLVSTCKGKVGKYFRGYVLDAESENTETNVKSALDWLSSQCEKTMLYTMYADYSRYLSIIANRPSTCAWWEARYGKNDGTYSSNYPCHNGVDFHQYTDQGSFAGVSGKIDLNRLTGTKKESWFTEKGETDMGYQVTFQTEERYKTVSYGDNSVYNSACGPAALCNALRAGGIANVDLLTMCRLAVSCGARVDGGTLEGVLLNAVEDKYGFTWKSTSKNAELLAHLKSGGVAILHAGSTYKLFSNSGHFVAAVAASGETITVLDSYWYSGKYTSTSLRRNNVKVISKGVIQTSLTCCGKATADRSPSYYLIHKKGIERTVTQKVNARAGATKDTDILGTIEKGAKIIVLDETENWLKTSVWIAKKYCTIKNGKATLKDNVNARSTNSADGTKLGVLCRGKTVDVLETTENWVEVAVWIAEKYTK